MLSLSKSLRTVSSFILCMAWLFFTGCSKQAQVDPGTNIPTLPSPGINLPPYFSGNKWVERAVPDMTYGFAKPFVVDNKVYVRSYDALFRYNEANNTWSKEDANMEFYYDVYLFSHLSKAYFLKQDKYLRAYDVNTHIWADRAAYPGLAAYRSTYAASANKGYVMGGQHNIDYQEPVLHHENWEYNFANNTWAKKADVPGVARYDAMSIALDDKIYFGTGATDGVSPPVVLLKDWWEFNTLTNTWTKKADFGGGARAYACGFVLDGKVYAGAGRKLDNSDQLSDLWLYDPGANTWAHRQTCPIGGPYWNDVMYVSTSSFGYGVNKDFNEFWYYKP